MTATLVLVALLGGSGSAASQTTPENHARSTSSSSSSSDAHSARIGEASPALETGLAILICGALVILLLARNELGKLEGKELP